MSTLRRLRSSPRARGGVQIVAILLLLVAAVAFTQRITGLEDQVTENRISTAQVGSILASTCGAADFAELQRQGLVEECRLAQAGELESALPDDAAVEPDAAVDVIPDDEDATPADVLPPMNISNARILAAVDAYFEESPIDLSPGYGRAIERTVTTYLVENPPAPGRPPTTEEIASAVQVALIANPPADGSDGADGADGASGSNGVSVATASLSGCDVVFTYSNGTTSAVGPVCGPRGEPGPPPSDTQVASALTAYCAANGQCRGPTGVVSAVDDCTPAEGEYVTDVAVAYSEESRTVTLSCTTAPVDGEPVLPPVLTP